MASLSRADMALALVEQHQAEIFISAQDPDPISRPRLLNLGSRSPVGIVFGSGTGTGT